MKSDFLVWDTTARHDQEQKIMICFLFIRKIGTFNFCSFLHFWLQHHRSLWPLYLRFCRMIFCRFCRRWLPLFDWALSGLWKFSSGSSASRRYNRRLLICGLRFVVGRRCGGLRGCPRLIRRWWVRATRPRTGMGRLWPDWKGSREAGGRRAPGFCRFWASSWRWCWRCWSRGRRSHPLRGRWGRFRPSWPEKYEKNFFNISLNFDLRNMYKAVTEDDCILSNRIRIW